MSTQDEYLQLNRKLNGLRERRAILVAREEDKKVERQQLEEQLRKEGLNPEKADEEIVRLEREIKADYDRAKSQIDEFEKELEAAEQGKAPKLTELPPHAPDTTAMAVNLQGKAAGPPPNPPKETAASTKPDAAPWDDVLDLEDEIPPKTATTAPEADNDIEIG